MPIHSYFCCNKKCNKEFEVFYTTQGAVVREESEEKCPHCGSKKKKRQVPKGTSFILRGPGWAKDNYGK